MTEEQPKPKPKRSIFNKPAFLSKPKPEANSGDPFHHASTTYAQIREEQEAKRRLKQAKKAQEEKEQAAREQEKAQSRENKRRRISQENEADSDDGRPLSSSKRTHLSVSPEEDSPRRRSTPRNSSPKLLPKPHEAVVTTSRAKPSTQHNVIELGDSDDEGDISIIASKLAPKQEPVPVEDESDPEEDEDIRKLKHQLREKRKLQERDKNSTPANYGMARTNNTATPEPVFDPVIQLLITSRLPDARPIAVKRRWTQNLQAIREKYCEMNNLPKTVFFTYRNRRLFDVTTCKSLGIIVDADGMPRIETDRDALSEDGTHIVVEAVTAEIWAENKKAAQEKYTKRFEVSNEEEEVYEEPPEEQRPQTVRLILRAKGYEPWKAKVNMEHTFGKIATAFRKQFNVPDDKEVFLVFDGDRLDPDDQVNTQEFEDQEMIEVHIK